MAMDAQSSGVRSSLELLRSAQAGEPQAVDHLYRRYLPPLRRWAHGRLPRFARDLVNTEDVIQETLVRTLHHVEGFEYRHQGAFQAYLRQGLRNRIRDEIRRVQRRPGQDTVQEKDALAATSPLEELVGREALERYERALARLRTADQQAIVARIELGMSYAEVAEAIDKPSEDAARMAVSRALLKLAREMSG
jgi:RNA polymerase sigma-70 factor (ECF subfamily)